MTDTQINRWSPYAIDGGHDAYGEMEEDEVGDYVNYEDHIAYAEAQDAQIKALMEALEEAGDVIESYHKSTGIDLGAASQMPFYSDTIAKIDAALAAAKETT